MSYLGRSAKLSLKAQEKVSFLATAGQTVKTGLSYTPSFVEVYVNGVLLTDTTDFTATNGNSITFTVALLLNDEVTVISLKTFTVADHYTKSDADTLLAAKAPIASPVLTGNVGINETSPAANLHLGASSPHIDIGPSGANRGKIGFNSNNVYIGSTSGAGEIHFKNNISSNDAPNSSGDTKMIIADSAVIIGNGVTLGNGTTYAAANTISDYETGSWTPSIGGNATYTNQVGRYIKIGNMVWVNFSIGINVQGTGSTSSGISGLPFASGLASQNTSNLTWYGLGVAMIYGVYYVGAGQSALSLSYTSGAATQLTNNPNSLVNGASINGSFAYTV